VVTLWGSEHALVKRVYQGDLGSQGHSVDLQAMLSLLFWIGRGLGIRCATVEGLRLRAIREHRLTLKRVEEKGFTMGI